MQVKELVLKDGSGGLNLDLHPSKIKENEYTVLENIITDEGGWPGKKRFGQDLAQYGPIAPTPFVNDANTLGLWHLDEASGGPWIDSSAGANDLTGDGAAWPASVVGLLPTGGPLGIQCQMPSATENGRGAQTIVANIVDNESEVVFECLVNIPATFTGKPIFYDRLPTSPGVFVSASGAPLVHTSEQAGVGPISFTDRGNGLTIHRDWDAVNQKDSSAPYVKFRLKTNGIAGTETILVSLALPTDRFIHVRGDYSSTTGVMRLFISGDLHATAVPTGGGSVNDSASNRVFVGADNDVGVYTGGLVKRVFPGIIDEVRISDALRATFPFKKPRGVPMKLEKSSGERFLVASADDGLFATVGDGFWTTIVASGLSSVAYWDGKQIGNILYMSNGVDAPRNWNGTNVFVSGEPITAPTITVEADAAAGPGAGTYNYAVTFFHGDKETGLGPASSNAVIAGANFHVKLTAIPTGSSTVTARGIYRKKSTSPAADWRLVRIIADNTTTQITGAYTAGTPSPTTDTGSDGIPQTSTGTGTVFPPIRATVYTTLFPNAAALLPSRRRMFFCAVKDRSFDLMWSEESAPEVVRTFSYVPGKKPLIAMTNFYADIHVSESGESTLVLRGETPSSWRNLSILHPTLGCTDHFGYVHRTLPGTDKYELCFPARDGFYRYRGFNFEKISTNINPLVDSLASFQSQRSEFIFTNEPDFAAGPETDGSASDNVYAPSYETDGIRQANDRLGIIDQLEYLGLWGANNSPTIGRVTAVAKGAAEGTFYYGTDGSPQQIEITNDNFVTSATTLPVGSAGEYPIAIVYASIAAVDNLFIFMSTAAGVGSIRRIQDPAGVATTTTLATALNFKTGSVVDGTVVDLPVAFGGTFSPQPIWDGTNSLLWFVAADLASTIYRSKAKTISLAGTVTNRNPPIMNTFGGLNPGYVALAKGVNDMFISYAVSSPGFGYTNRLATALLANPAAITDLSPLDFFTNALKFVRRLSYNSNNGRLVGLGGEISDRTGAATTHGVIFSVSAVTGFLTDLKDFAESSAIPLEIAYQTTTPYAHYVAMQAIDATEVNTLYKVAAASAAASDVDIYKTDPYNSATGLISNLLFVPSSGAAGTYLWSDRLYWMTKATSAADARMVQLGVPGTWTVVGEYESKTVAAQTIGAYDDFSSEFDGQAAFEMRNGTGGGISTATYFPVTPNAKITAFSAPSNVTQWRTTLTWIYTVAAPSPAPAVRFVRIGYFSKDVVVPRLVGHHWNGRSYWSAASPGMTENDIMLVYQNNNSWTTYKGWNVVGMIDFRNQFMAFQGHALVRLESGRSDLGNFITPLAVSGYIMDDLSDKCLRHVNVNLNSYVNSDFPTKDGWAKIVAYGAGVPLGAGAFVFPIPAAGGVYPRQVLGFQPATADGEPFVHSYTRALAIGYTSTEDEANYLPYFAQPEDIASVILRFFISPPRHRIVSP